MPDITIPPDQDLQTGSFKGRDGQDVPYVQFACTHQGKLLAQCQAYGGEPRKAQILEAMTSGKPLVAESLTWNERNKRWDVRFPKGSGGEAGYRSRFGGAQRPWQPSGYRGQPVPFERWLAITGEVFAAACVLMADTASAWNRGSDELADMRATILEQSRSLVAQYWMSVEHNLTFPAGYEPAPVVSTPVPDAKPTDAEKSNGPGVASDVHAPGGAFVEAIGEAKTEMEVRQLMDSIRKTITDKVKQAELLTVCLQRLRAVSTLREDT